MPKYCRTTCTDQIGTRFVFCLFLGLAVAMCCSLPSVASPFVQTPEPSSPTITVPARPEQRKVGYFSPEKRFYMPPAPREEPSLVPGRHFFCLSGMPQVFITPDDKPVLSEEVAMKVLVLREVSDKRLTFTSEDGTTTYVLPLIAPLKDTESLPSGIVPVLEDVESEALRKKYEQEFVFPFPGFTVSRDQITYYGFHIAKIRLLRLRLSSRYSLLTGGYEFEAYDPLIALFDLPHGGHHVGSNDPALWTMSPDDINELSAGIEEIHPLFTQTDGGHLLFARKGKPTYYAYFASTWDLERAISRVSVEDASVRWPATYRNAVLSPAPEAERFSSIRKGMTPDMVAWIMGWPPQYGTRDELRRQSRWTYRGPATGDVSVFFRNGHVFKWIGRAVPYEPWNPP